MKQREELPDHRLCEGGALSEGAFSAQRSKDSPVGDPEEIGLNAEPVTRDAEVSDYEFRCAEQASYAKRCGVPRAAGRPQRRLVKHFIDSLPLYECPRGPSPKLCNEEIR